MKCPRCVAAGRGQAQGRVRLQPLQAGTQLQTVSGDGDPLTTWSHPLTVSKTVISANVQTDYVGFTYLSF